MPPRRPSASSALAGWAAQFTPSVALELPDSLALEVSGSLKLFRGLERIAASLRDGCARMGLTALVAAAPTARGASWLAHAGSERLVAGPAALPGALAGLPVRVMIGDDAAREALAAIGATRVGDVAALPRAGLARRFGRQLVDDLDRALGRAPDPRTFFTPPAEFRARLELPAEVTQTEALLFAARRLFVQLEGFLAARAGGVQRLALKLFHRQAKFTEVPIGLVAPARDAAHFTLLARERLGGASAAAKRYGRSRSTPATSCRSWAKRLRSSTTARLRRATGRSSSSGSAPGSAGWPCTVLPSLRSIGRSVRRGKARSTPASADADPPGLRPFWLLPAPEPLAEIDAAPHRGGPLKLLAGPERIESGWWDGGDVARDYFVAETAERALVWVYRERHPPGGWFLHGLFA